MRKKHRHYIIDFSIAYYNNEPYIHTSKCICGSFFYNKKDENKHIEKNAKKGFYFKPKTKKFEV